MPLTHLFESATKSASKLTRSQSYACATAIAIVSTAARFGITPIVGEEGVAYLLPYFATLISSTLLRENSGALTGTLAVLLGYYFFIPPAWGIGFRPDQLFTLGLSITFVILLAKIIETLRHVLLKLSSANTDLEITHQRQLLLLKEYRHRTRNDLQSLVGIFLLLVRQTKNVQVQDGLRTAANHALALARVHTRLEQAHVEQGAVAYVDTCAFIEGLLEDLQIVLGKDGMRSIGYHCDAEKHQLTTERALHLGLIIDELVQQAAKCAFPNDLAGNIHIDLVKTNGDLVLTVRDDGVSHEERERVCDSRPGGLGQRVLQALAAQLRGSFTRVETENGSRAQVTFPLTSIHNVYG